MTIYSEQVGAEDWAREYRAPIFLRAPFLAPNPQPSAFMAGFFAHRADLWEPVWQGAADSDQRIAYWRPRYLGISCFIQTHLRPPQLALFGNWDGKSPPAILHVPKGTLVGDNWAAIDRTLERDGSHSDSWGACFMACSQPRPVSSAGFNDAAEVQIDCLRVPKRPDEMPEAP